MPNCWEKRHQKSNYIMEWFSKPARRQLGDASLLVSSTLISHMSSSSPRSRLGPYRRVRLGYLVAGGVKASAVGILIPELVHDLALPPVNPHRHTPFVTYERGQSRRRISSKHKGYNSNVTNRHLLSIFGFRWQHIPTTPRGVSLNVQGS